ncbi:AAA family ATPase [Carnobacterium mobile]|uniref:AAA family ATPase n=1 Tax=Carnobacterium mobile TaxID=2750 RepID=UPI000555DF78|nr:AAA family ATPase [Carnobacterium mobile]
MELDIKVFFEPKIKFSERLSQFDNVVSFSEVTKNWISNSSIESIIEPLLDKDICIITTEDCSGLNSHVLENFDFLIKLFDLSSIDKVWINNPPHFFLEKITQHSPDIPIEYYKYSKIDESIIKKVNQQFDDNIIGQKKAKNAICRKLIAQMIRPSNKPLVLMFYGKPGIGKTETAKYLSKILYGNDGILREQMTMVGGETSIKYFKATSHSEDSFSKKLLNRKSNIILLDEFALAPHFFHTSFFQMFDEGVYMDQNFNVDVSNSIIICTSNLLSIKEMEGNIDEALLSRFDGFIHFTDFTKDEKKVIIKKIFDELVAEGVMDPKYRKVINEEAILLRVNHKLEKLPNMRAIRKYVEDCVSDSLLEYVLK